MWFLGGALGRKAALRDVHDGCERCSPGLWLLTVRLLFTCSLWLDTSRYLWEAAFHMTAEGWLRDLVLRAIVESPLSPWDAAFLKMLLEGRLARGGHFRRLEEKDGIAGSLVWAFLSVLLNLAGEPECVTLGSIAAGDSFTWCARDPRAKGQVARGGQAQELVSRTITCLHWNRWQVSDWFFRQSSSWGRF